MTQKSDRPGADQAAHGAGEGFADASNPRNSKPAPAKRDSPWTAAPALVPQPCRFAARLFLHGERPRIVLRLVKPDQSPDFVELLHQCHAKLPCGVCKHVYIAGTGAFVAVRSTTNRRALGTLWFCDRCAETDDDALLDFAENSFRAGIEAASDSTTVSV